jgi:hypothetical protein
MSPSAETILSQLQQVAAERGRRAGDAGLLARVQALKAYQQQRFALTYADLLAHPRYQAAARFFLDELYGPSDFTRRDEQFARVVPALVRLFPEGIVDTVAALARLHAISERLDTEMALRLEPAAPDATSYIRAWQQTGEAAAREEQIGLLVTVGERLDGFTRKPLLRQSLRMMRGPAAAAGLQDLQRFLEAGFDTFRGMRGAAEFLDCVASRERALAARLFAATPPHEGDLLASLP